MRIPSATVAAFLPAALLAGCTAQENARSDIGAGVTLASISGEAGPPLESPEPSVLTVERKTWTPVEFRVPLDTTAHQPSYRWEDLPASYVASGRDLGDYPTASTALSTGGSDGAALNLLASPVIAGGEVATGIIGLFIVPPWTITHSPPQGYAYSRLPPATPRPESGEPDDGGAER